MGGPLVMCRSGRSAKDASFRLGACPPLLLFPVRRFPNSIAMSNPNLKTRYAGSAVLLLLRDDRNSRRRKQRGGCVACEKRASKRGWRKFLLVDGNNAIFFALVLVSADFLVLALALIHESLELGIVVLGNSLGGHLDGAGTASCGDSLGDLLDGFFEDSDTDGLVESLRGENVERRRDKLDLDLGVLGVASLSLAQGGLDGVDSFITEAGDFDIGTNLCGLGCQALANV
jgi:hypothetical protein